MTRLVLVRHGQSVGNAEHRIQGHLDTSLTATGVDQSRRLAERFSRESIHALYSSPLCRARATADAIGARLQLRVQEVADMRERAAGEMTGLTREEVRRRFAGHATGAANTSLAAIAGVELKADFRHRVMAALERIVVAQQDQAVVIVTHRGVIDAICRWALDTPDARYAFGNASVTSIDVALTDGGTLHPWLIALNDTAHLATAPLESAALRDIGEH